MDVSRAQARNVQNRKPLRTPSGLERANCEITGYQAVSKWLKGGPSPNPGGRPKEIGDLRQMARERTPEALQTLVEVMLDRAAPAAARVAAANGVLDRGHGKADRHFTVDGAIEHRQPASDLDLARRIMFTLAMAKARKGEEVDDAKESDAWRPSGTIETAYPEQGD